MKTLLTKKTTLAGLLVACFVLANAIISRSTLHIDLTSGRFYTLSEGSKEILRKIDPRDPIEITYYYSASLPGVPIMFKNFADRIKGLLEQYVAAAKGKIRLTIIDPKPDTPEEERAIRAGLQPQPISTGENFFLGLVVTQAEQTQTLPFFNPQREGLLEYDISQLLHRVQLTNLPKLGIITGLPMFGRTNAMFMRSPQQEWYVVEELRKSFDVRILSEEIPEDIDVLAVIHPVDLSPVTEYYIDQFLLRGKPVFIAVDPSSVYLKQNPSSNLPVMVLNTDTASDLPNLFQSYGIIYDKEKIVLDSENAALVNVDPSSPPIPYPPWIEINKFPLSSAATASLTRVLLAETGAISVAEGSTLQFTPILSTSNSSRLIEKSLLQFSTPSEVIRLTEPPEQSKTIAALITGKFHSAFPEGKPAQPKESADNAEVEKKADTSESTLPHLKESASNSTLLLIADTDFLADNFSVQVFKFFGYRAIQPINDNLALAANTLEVISGSQDLIRLRSKGPITRPFQRIINMEIKAQREFQKQLEQLDNQLQLIRGELETLTREQRNQGRLALSPEIQAKIDDFRAQEASVRAKRREIRKQLREDIEKLNIALAGFNLLTVPISLAMYAVWYFRKRSQRQAHTLKEDTA